MGLVPGAVCCPSVCAGREVLPRGRRWTVALSVKILPRLRLGIIYGWRTRSTLGRWLAPEAVRRRRWVPEERRLAAHGRPGGVERRRRPPKNGWFVTAFVHPITNDRRFRCPTRPAVNWLSSWKRQRPRDESTDSGGTGHERAGRSRRRQAKRFSLRVLGAGGLAGGSHRQGCEARLLLCVFVLALWKSRRLKCSCSPYRVCMDMYGRCAGGRGCGLSWRKHLISLTLRHSYR